MSTAHYVHECREHYILVISDRRIPVASHWDFTCVTSASGSFDRNVAGICWERACVTMCYNVAGICWESACVMMCYKNLQCGRHLLGECLCYKRVSRSYNVAGVCWGGACVTMCYNAAGICWESTCVTSASTAVANVFIPPMAVPIRIPHRAGLTTSSTVLSIGRFADSNACPMHI